MKLGVDRDLEWSDKLEINRQRLQSLKLKRRQTCKITGFGKEKIVLILFKVCIFSITGSSGEYP